MSTASISPEKIAELRRLCEEATPGPWTVVSHGMHWDVKGVANLLGLANEEKRNGAFICAAREALPALLSITEQPIPEEVEAMIDGLLFVRALLLEGAHETHMERVDSAIALLRRWPRPTPEELDVLISRATDTVPPLPGGNHD